MLHARGRVSRVQGVGHRAPGLGHRAPGLGHRAPGGVHNKPAMSPPSATHLGEDALFKLLYDFGVTVLQVRQPVVNHLELTHLRGVAVWGG